MSDASDLFERLRAPLADRYELERELGSGGMSHVFLARDVKHDREVALKVFRPELAVALGVDRFLREIQIAAKLSHPHILPLYDSGEVDGFLYYTMPFVEGESLGDRLRREQMLPLDDALDIAREVADGLNYAHERGLVHRDIKPDNIMLTGGHAVVMDFGIARAVEVAGGDELTQTGMAIGSPLYMSPEQATAEIDLDGRSDIYSLGCVLYEMVAGTPPFTGPSQWAVVSRHLADQVTSPTIMRKSISPELEAVILCSLAKAPADRFKTAGEFGEALKVLQTGSGTMPQLSAVTQAGPAGAGRPNPSTANLRTRRVPQLAAAYGAGSWLVLGVFSQLVEMGLLPQVVYWLALTLVVSMAPGVLVVAWFHGEKGAQEAPLIEKWILAGVAVLALASTTWVYSATVSPTVEIGGPALNRVAVLYLEDLSPNQEFQYVADGITEGLIRSLSQVSALEVVSRNGVAPFRDADVSRDSIARALQVGSLIVGSVEATGGQLRISTELVEGASGAPIERASFELPVDNLLQVQESVVQDVEGLLRSWIGEEVRVQAQRGATSSDIAWALVRRGELARRQAEELILHDDLLGAYNAYLSADSLFQQAELGDDTWVEPVLLRGDVAYDLYRIVDEPGEVLAEAEAHAERALAMDPDHPEAHQIRGISRYTRWLLRLTNDQDEADRLLEDARSDLEFAVNTDATLARANNALSHLFYQRPGEEVNVVLYARRAYEADAFLAEAGDILDRLYNGYYALQQPREAERWCDEGVRRFPNDARFSVCRLWLMTTDLHAPDVAEAWRLAERVATIASGPGAALAEGEARLLVGGVLARASLPDSARTVMLDARLDRTDDPELDLTFIEAYMRVLVGDQDEAIDLLKGWLVANPELDHGLEDGMNWWWGPLQSHPRFGELLRGGA